MNLDAANEARKKGRELGIKLEVLDPIAKAKRKPSSLRLAINGKCWDCIGAGYDPNPRKAIRECSDTECTLHAVRPYQKKESTELSPENVDNF